MGVSATRRKMKQYTKTRNRVNHAYVIVDEIDGLSDKKRLSSFQTKSEKKLTNHSDIPTGILQD